MARNRSEKRPPHATAMIEWALAAEKCDFKNLSETDYLVGGQYDKLPRDSLYELKEMAGDRYHDMAVYIFKTYGRNA